MDNISDFLKLINIDLLKYRPNTTELEKSFLIQKGFESFKNYNPNIELKDSIDIIDLEQFKKDYLLNIGNKNNLFMCRLLSSEITLPHVIPNNYEIFYETSEDIYTNYLSTLNNLNNQLFNVSDIEKLENILQTKDCIFCWSNPSIILNKILKETNYKNLFVLTYGSPILLPIYNTKYCINIYHENDWIFKLLKLYYKIDFNNFEKDKILSLTIDNNKCLFIILSRKYFINENSEPHRCFNLFL